MNLIEPILADAASIAALRRDIHAHPELCYEENRTADLVAKALTDWGIPVHRGLGKTGVVGIVKNGSSQRAVGLRADMDALPMTEHNTFAHASKHAGKMHACGHDGHTAMLLAAAKHLAKHRNFDGTVYLVFQPAEEGGAGARAMIDDGLFDKFPMEAIFGAHNWPGYAVGSFGVSTGPMMASGSQFTLTVRGKGSHAALSYLGVDPVPVACQIVMAWQTIVSRNLRAMEAAVISATMINAGEAFNVIPDSASIKGTVRTLSDEAVTLIERRMREVAEGICAAHGATCEFEFNRGYPVTVNHAAETGFVKGVLAEVVGAANVRPFEPTMGSEDFSFFLQAKPGCYFMIGNGDGAHRSHGHGEGPCTLHNPSYDFNDELIPLGATAWVRIAERWLATPR
ncbi:MAG: amidohydrolase [Rubrivivax sp.]|nr:amidohydrolase [Rubrivivax sp.]MCL4697226.1 amidohydrolase [Burkholderiaceae bacterium]